MPARATKLDATGFDGLLRQNNPFTNAGQGIFDLRGITFITPAGLVELTAACHALSATGRDPTVIIEDPNVRTYLLRAAFFSSLDGVATIQPALYKPQTMVYEYMRGNNPLLIEAKISSGAA